MSSTPVQRDQFEVSPKGITDKPTGAMYTPVCTENLSSGVVVMKSAQDGA
jgi:hypothetical protein